MREEKSCGAIVFRCPADKLEVLLLKHRNGHWDFPKGHVEPGESEQETALREVREESGLTVEIAGAGFRQLIRYSPARDSMKDVVFFIAKYVSGVLAPQPSEISQALWLEPQGALTRLTHQSSRDLLRRALIHLREHTLST